MRTDLTLAQQELATLMAQMSQRAYRAQWMLSVEVELWRAMQAPDGGGPPHSLTPAEAARLRAMAETCGGWMAFDRAKGFVFVPMDDWLLKVGSEARR